VVVVGQSFGGHTAPIVADRIGGRLIVLVAGMVPSPGESAEEMFERTGWQSATRKNSSTRDIFYHDVPADIADEAMRRGGRHQSATPGAEPWPMPSWPAIPTRFVLCRRDGFFQAGWLRALVRARLPVEPEEIDSGHCVALSRPGELARLLDRYAAEIQADTTPL
jgi:pimeloyl-ACP methyl ester carboxylesterase